MPTPLPIDQDDLMVGIDLPTADKSGVWKVIMQRTSTGAYLVFAALYENGFFVTHIDYEASMQYRLARREFSYALHDIGSRISGIPRPQCASPLHYADFIS